MTARLTAADNRFPCAETPRVHSHMTGLAPADGVPGCGFITDLLDLRPEATRTPLRATLAPCRTVEFGTTSLSASSAARAARVRHRETP